MNKHPLIINEYGKIERYDSSARVRAAFRKLYVNAMNANEESIKKLQLALDRLGMIKVGIKSTDIYTIGDQL